MGGPSRLLWELVHSLNDSEVQKFKDRAYEYKRGKYANYIVLFDAVRKQDEFNDEELRRKLSKHSFAKHLHRTKNYLYWKILDYVREAHPGEDSELYALLEKMKILFEKRLYNHLPTLIEKGKKLALSMEAFSSMRKILEYQRGILRYNRGWDHYNQEIDNVLRQEELNWAKETNLVALERIESDFLKIWGQEKPGKDKIIKETLGNPIIMDSKNALSASALIIQRHIVLHVHFFSGDYKKAISECDQIVTIFQSNPGLMADNRKYTTLGLAIFWSSSFRLLYNEIEEAQSKFDQLEAFAQTDKRVPAFHLERKTLFELIIARKTLDYERGKSATDHFTKSLGKYSPVIDKTTLFEICHLAGEFFIYFNEPKEALKWVIMNRNEKPGSNRPDLLHFSKILFLMIHWELGNIDLIERELRSIRTAFAKHKVNNPYYDFISQTFSTLTKGKSEPKEIFRNALNVFRSNQGTPIWNQMENYLDFEVWLESKATRIPIIEILKNS